MMVSVLNLEKSIILIWCGMNPQNGPNQLAHQYETEHLK